MTQNPMLSNAPFWLSILDLTIFTAAFATAAYWAHEPLRLATQKDSEKDFHEALEYAMAMLPWRAIKSFFLAGLGYVLYLCITISTLSFVSDLSFTPRMVIALGLCIMFGLGVLAPTLAIALTMAWMANVRKQLSQQRLFIGNLEQFHSYHWLIRSSNRPWLIFTVTSLLPVSILGLFTWLMLGTTNEAEQHFILMQAVVLFFALIFGGTALVWVTSHTVRRITRELSTGLNHLRQGKFDSHVAIMVDDDMGDLARGINTALAGLKERDNLKDALAIASDIQKGLMPLHEPNVAGYAIAGFQQSCYAVGGDYYDYIERANGTTWLVIADVAGKGYPAALTVANLQAMLHALANSSHINLLDAVTYINQSLHESLQGGRFVTFFIAELDSENHHLQWLNAGHVPPLLWQQNKITHLEATSPPLGMLDHIPLQTRDLNMEKGDVLFSCTDGVTESRNSAGDEMFGDKR
ncbi:MAG: PP2C family protein-serine/threonine phosphatase, partial [Ghiorsea sp.]